MVTKNKRGRKIAWIGAASLVVAGLLAAPLAANAIDGGSAEPFNGSVVLTCDPGGAVVSADFGFSGTLDVGVLVNGNPGVQSVVDSTVSLHYEAVVPAQSPGPNMFTLWTGTPANLTNVTGTFTFPDDCEEPVPDPSASDTSASATASSGDPRSVSVNGSTVLSNITDQSVSVSYTLVGPGGPVSSTTGSVNGDGSFSTTITPGSIPDGSYYVVVDVLINGTSADGTTTNSVTFETPVDPTVPASVSGAFTGVLVDNVPTVEYQVTLTPNDDTGPQVVEILDGTTVVATIPFESSEGSASGSFQPGKSGDITYVVRIVRQEEGVSYVVSVPEPVNSGGGDGDGDGNGGGDGDGNGDGDGGSNGGSNGGNTGGSTDGSTNGGNTGGTDTNTNTTPNTTKDLGYPQTDDVFFASSVNGGLLGGSLGGVAALGLIAFAAVMYVRSRRSSDQPSEG